MPGISPRFAISLKQILHKPKSRIKARLRPQRKQRRVARLENFGFFFDFAICASVAMPMLFKFTSSMRSKFYYNIEPPTYSNDSIAVFQRGEAKPLRSCSWSIQEKSLE